MLHGWIQRPHVAEWWAEPTTIAELEDAYCSRAARDSSTRPYIALLDAEPLGFIQSYVALGSGDGWCRAGFVAQEELATPDGPALLILRHRTTVGAAIDEVRA